MGWMLLIALGTGSATQASELPWLGRMDPFFADSKTADVVDPSLHPNHCATPDLARILDIGDVITLALCNNPDTRYAYLNLMADAAAVGSQYSAYLPDVIAGASHTNTRTYLNRKSQGDVDSGLSVTAGMVLYDFGRREATIDAAEYLLATSGYNYNSTLQAVIAFALQQYYQLLTSQQSLEAAIESENFARESYEAADQRYNIGQVPVSDQLQAKGSYSQAKLATEQARNKLAQDQASIATLFGLPPDTPIMVKDIDDATLPTDPFNGNVRSLMEMAKEKRYDLVAARSRIESGKASLTALKRSDLPTISALAGGDTFGYNPLSTGRERSHSIGVSLSVPIFTGFRQTYNEREARRRLEADQELLVKSELDVERDVWNTWHNYETAKQSWETSGDLLVSATSLKEITLGRYTEGLGTILDVLNAQLQYTYALQNQLQAHYALLTTRIDLVRSVGMLNLESAQYNVKVDDPGAPPEPAVAPMEKPVPPPPEGTPPENIPAVEMGPEMPVPEAPLSPEPPAQPVELIEEPVAPPPAETSPAEDFNVMLDEPAAAPEPVPGEEPAALPKLPRVTPEAPPPAEEAAP